MENRLCLGLSETTRPQETRARAVPAAAMGLEETGFVDRRNRGCNSMVEYLPSKQATWVRFPSPAFIQGELHLKAANMAMAKRVR
jgi:hypothetical protein